MKRTTTLALFFCCTFILFSATSCQELELWKYGIGEKEINYITEEHRRACEQPSGPRLHKDKCGRLVYPDGEKHN